MESAYKMGTSDLTPWTSHFREFPGGYHGNWCHGDGDGVGSAARQPERLCLGRWSARWRWRSSNQHWYRRQREFRRWNQWAWLDGRRRHRRQRCGVRAGRRRGGAAASGARGVPGRAVHAGLLRPRSPAGGHTGAAPVLLPAARVPARASAEQHTRPGGPGLQHGNLELYSILAQLAMT